MSMYPTNISGGDTSRRINRLGIPTQNMGIDQQLSVVGLTPSPVNTGNISAANALGEAFGLAAQATGAILRVNEQQRIAQQREDENVAIFDRGEAVKAAQGTYAELQPQIADRTLIAAVSDAELGDYVGDLISARSEGQSQAWRDEYDRQLRGRLLSDFGKQRAAIREESKNNLVDAAKNAAIGARSSDDITLAIDSAKSIGLSELEAVGSVAVPALKLAAIQGDTEKFDAVVASIPDSMYREEIMMGRVRLDQVRVSNENTALKENEKAFSSWYTSDATQTPAYEDAIERLNKTTLLPIDRQQWLATINNDRQRRFVETRQSAEDSLAGLVTNGSLDEAQVRIAEYETMFGEEWGLSQRARLSSLVNKQNDDSLAAAETSWKNAIIQEATRQSIGAVDGTGVALASLPKDFQSVIGDKQVKLTREGVIEAIVPAEMQRIAQMSNDPAWVFGQQVEWLSKNGVEYEPWKQGMSIGASASSESLSNPDRAKPAVDGFNLYRQLKAQNPAFAFQMTNESTRRFYDLAESYNVAGLNPADAMLRARLQLDDELYPQKLARAYEQVGQKYNNRYTLPDFYASKAVGTDVRNLNEVSAVIKERAAKLVAGGIDPESALKTEADKFKASSVVIGGENNRRAINTAYSSFTPSMKMYLGIYADNILDYLHSGNGPLSGYGRQDLSLAFNPETNVFHVIDLAGRAIVAPGTRINAEDFEATAIEAARENTNAGKRRTIKMPPPVTAPTWNPFASNQ